MIKKPRWTEEECVIVRKHVASNPKTGIYNAQSEIVKKTGHQRSVDAIRKKWLDISTNDIADATATSQTVVEWPDKKQAVIDWRSNLSAADAAVRRHRMASSSQDVATVVINTTKPVAVCYSSDWHLGSICSDHLALKTHIEYILNTPDLYLISNGDENDNMQIFRNVSARAQSLPISEQAKTFAAIYHELCENSKLLCAGYGNHSEEFEEANIGYSYTAMIKGSKVPYFRGIGKLFLKVGNKEKQEYIHIMSHDGRGNSSSNPLHGAQKLAAMYEPNADVAVASHTHNPAFSYCFGHGLEDYKDMGVTFPHKPRVDVRTGTFKVGDPFSQRYFGRGKMGLPTIVFMPDHKEMVPFATPELAIAFMKGYSK